MKKFIATILILSILISTLALIGCQENTTQVENGELTLEFQGTKLVWNKVENAESYYINVRFSPVSSFQLPTKETEYTIKETKAGEYLYSVKAKIGGKLTASSNQIKIVLGEKGEKIVSSISNGVETEILRSGDGSAENPIAISTRQELASISTGTKTVNVDGVNTQQPLYYKQVCDIDLSGSEWLPLSAAFAGVYDGGYHKIIGLSVTYCPNSNKIGLFGNVNKGTVKNVRIENASVTIPKLNGDKCYVGLLIGYAENAIVENCSVQGKIDVPAAEAVNRMVWGGMLIGAMGGTSVSRCSARGEMFISYGKVYAGGLVGYMKSPQSKNKVTDSYSRASVSAYAVGKDSSGSVVAVSAAGSMFGYISYADEVGISNCYGTGEVKVTGRDGTLAENLIKGFAGGTNGNITTKRSSILFNNCFFAREGVVTEYDTKVYDTPQKIAEFYGVGNKEHQMKNSTLYALETADLAKQESYIGWDFQTVWMMQDGLPILQWEYKAQQ